MPPQPPAQPPPQPPAQPPAQPRALTTIERAYQLAREGPCATIEEIGKQLHREQYTSVGSHLTGPTIRRQLRTLCRAKIAAAKA